MDTSGGGPPHRGPGRDGAGAPADPGRRAPVERTDQVVSRHPGQRVPDKTDRTSIGLCATGRRQERREQDARARERLDDAGGLELLRLPLFPIGVAEPLGDALLLDDLVPIHGSFPGALREQAPPGSTCAPESNLARQTREQAEQVQRDREVEAIMREHERVEHPRDRSIFAQSSHSTLSSPVRLRHAFGALRCLGIRHEHRLRSSST